MAVLDEKDFAKTDAARIAVDCCFGSQFAKPEAGRMAVYKHRLQTEIAKPNAARTAAVRTGSVHFAVHKHRPQTEFDDHFATVSFVFRFPVLWFSPQPN